MGKPKYAYAVQPKCFSDRKADYKEQEHLNEVFETISHEKMYEEIEMKAKKGMGGTCGNIAWEINFARPKNKVLVNITPGEENMLDKGEDAVRSYQVISSAFMLYRMICMFPNPIVEMQGSEGYKVPWSIALKHKETGEFFIIREWKGGLSFASDSHSFKETPESFTSDVKRLLQLLVSDKSPHPYDGVTAGGVA